MTKTLDIIIPVYNDTLGLFDSLCSIGKGYTLPIGKIIIIDDCSSKEYNYQSIIQFFGSLYTIEFYQLEHNSGPAAARNKGLEEATADYIMFLDCGDTICNQFILGQVFDDIANNSDCWMFSYAHSHQNSPEDYNDNFIGPWHNHLMGKVFKRDFLERFNVHFNAAAGYANEDIGFNTLCRLLCANDKEPRVFESENLFVRWTYNPNSLTRVNNHAFYYRAALDMARNAIYAFKEALRCGVDFRLIREKAYDVFCFTYFSYCGALNSRPELANKVFEGAFYLYKEYFCNMETNFDSKLFLNHYNHNLLSSDINDPFFVNFPSFNIIDFLNILEQKTKEETSND